MPAGMPLYPVNLVVDGRRCLVVGGGPVAARKALGLVECGAEVHVVGREVGPEVRAIAAATVEERPYDERDLDGCWLVVTATDDPALNRRIHDEAVARRIWVNSADDPANCTFILPAVVRQGPLVVTVSTSGQSPALSSWLRGRLEGELGPEYEALLGILSGVREEIRAAGRPTEGLDWQSALDSGMLELVREGRLAEAKERLQACLSSPSA
jgi:precorrin-2 dehydrogenase / sirohydrochlorin ferrochelatase